jgi:DNA-binding response OmpR family regulator
MAAADDLGARTHWCVDGASALIAVGAEDPTLLVIAARIDGAVTAKQVIESVRKHSDVPILVGADPADHEAANAGLAAGGSALVVRPYDLSAIAAMAHVPHTYKPPAARREAGPIMVNPVTHEVRVGDRDILLTARELDLLVYLIDRRGRVASAHQISNRVWGRSSDTNTVAVHIKRLRAKLGTDPEHGQLIRTIRGVGYRLAPSICR